MSLEPSYLTTLSFEYSNTPKAQGKHHKTNFIQMIEVLKEEVKKNLLKNWGNDKQLEKINKALLKKANKKNSGR